MKTKLRFCASIAALGNWAMTGTCVMALAAVAHAATKDETGKPFAVETVVVTAEKRAEDVQTVPVSVSVLGGDTLERYHVQNLTDYASYIPGFQVDSLGRPGENQITLRGISGANFAESTVATYVDDSPLGSSSLFAQGASFILDLMPYDLDHIEVLRGPQGTLYGAGSIGGLLKYVTKSPDLNEFSARLGGDVFTIHGSGGIGWNARAMINVPIIDGELAAHGTFYHDTTPGFIDNVLRNQEDVNKNNEDVGRLSVLWRPSADFSIKFAVMLQTIATEGPSNENRNLVSAAPRPGFLVGPPTFGDRTEATLLPRLPFGQHLQFYGATVDWDLHWADLISAASYSKTDTTFTNDLSHDFAFLIPIFTGGVVPSGYTPVDDVIDLDKFTEELRLVSPSGQTLDWIVGVFYTHEHAFQSQTLRAFQLNDASIPAINPFGTILLPSTYEEIAVFGDATYRISERFDVTGGLRYSTNFQNHTQSTFGPIFGGSASQFGSSTEHDFTFAVSPRFRLSDDAMAYARVATGYGPGGPNFPSPGIPSTTHSQTDISYEIGTKDSLLDKRLVIDAAVFYIDWSNIQVNCVKNGVGFNCNGPKAKSLGVELSTTYTPIDGLTLGSNLAFTDARLTRDAPQIQGLKGNRLPLSPVWATSLTADYTFAAWDTWNADLGAVYRFVGDRYSQVQSNPQTIHYSSYGAIDMRAGLADEAWRLELYARNVTDKRGILSAFLDTTLGGAPLDIRTSILQPRTIGISIDRSF